MGAVLERRPRALFGLFPGHDGLAYPDLKLPGGRDVPELSVGRERAVNRITGKPNF